MQLFQVSRVTEANINSTYSLFTGPIGSQGVQGIPGAQGPIGPKGEAGATGQNGNVGPQGKLLGRHCANPNISLFYACLCVNALSITYTRPHSSYTSVRKDVKIYEKMLSRPNNC
jgi:Collagen triple helix repeat (20 copies)